MSRQKLNDAELAAALATLPGWTIQDGKLHRQFTCQDFSEAFAKMTRVALAAEKMDHHPDWSNVWNKVTVNLTTHSAGGITPRDFELARQIQAIFEV